ncbi:MAG: ATP-binding protein [bacterium]
MSWLSTVTSESKPKPPLTVIHGDGGVGKSTLAANGKSPLFIPFEDGLAGLQGVARTSRPESLAQFLSLLDELEQEEHDFRTVIIDSADWAEPVLEAAVCEMYGAPRIADIDYGKGYAALAETWVNVLNRLTRLRDNRGIFPLVICHSAVSQAPDPLKGEHPQWTLKLQKKSAARLVEWADIVGYAAVEYAVTKEKGGFGRESKRAVGTGERLLHLQPSPAFVAKNRYGMPASIPLDWAAFTQAYMHAVNPQPQEAQQ